MKKPSFVFHVAICFFLIILSQSSMAQSNFPCGTKTTQEDIDYLIQNRAARTKHAFSIHDKSNASINYFPVRHHVIRNNDGTGGTNIAELEAAMNNLNDFYIQGNIQFFTCQTIDYINSTEHYDFLRSDINDFADIHDEENMLNFYYFNSIENNESTSWCGFSVGNDRILMVNGCLDGRTFVHELGHYFSLAHTHGPFDCPDPEDRITDELVTRGAGRNCETAGDTFCDTPADPHMGCGRDWVNGDCEYTGDVVDANGDSFDPLTNNIMSYGNSHCSESFTNDQWQAINFSAQNQRNYLLCLPCPGSDVVLTDPIPSTADVIYGSVDDIFATNLIHPGAQVQYIARDMVSMQPGFSVIANQTSIFRARIHTCVIPNNPPVVIN